MTDYTRNTSIPENPDNWNRIADKLPPEGVLCEVVLRGREPRSYRKFQRDRWIIDGSAWAILAHPNDEWRPYEKTD